MCSIDLSHGLVTGVPPARCAQVVGHLSGLGEMQVMVVVEYIGISSVWRERIWKSAQQHVLSFNQELLKNLA